VFCEVVNIVHNFTKNNKNGKDKDIGKMYALQAATQPKLSILLKSDSVCLTVEYACCGQAAAVGRRPKSTSNLYRRIGFYL